jgi:hypothetical protein
MEGDFLVTKNKFQTTPRMKLLLRSLHMIEVDLLITLIG